jgi:hypothetical protein
VFRDEVVEPGDRMHCAVGGPNAVRCRSPLWADRRPHCQAASAPSFQAFLPRGHICLVYGARRSIAALFAQLSFQSTLERRVLRCQPHPTSDAAADILHVVRATRQLS